MGVQDAPIPAQTWLLELHPWIKRNNAKFGTQIFPVWEQAASRVFYPVEVVRTTIYLQNWTSTNGGLSPHELYFGKKLNLAHLRIFGSIAYVHVPKEKRRKLDAKAEKCLPVHNG